MAERAEGLLAGTGWLPEPFLPPAAKIEDGMADKIPEELAA
jgi:hypothetical protein